ncbi:MAG: SulP family inorganic anion transporter [Bdellovibrionales bacterium]|nr:SulP family inorganic anion transporter [Bdellovibrionales bacterium]
MFVSEWLRVVRAEFQDYNRSRLLKDLMAGAATAAVALPLALAFGVASGADAAAGLVTAIVAGIVIGGLGGTHFQISGPTGAMSAVLIVLSARHGMASVWVAGMLAGLLIFLAGAFRLGRIVSLIPGPVITGFTSGIAVIIMLGQVDNLFGTRIGRVESVVRQFEIYLQDGITINFSSLAVGLLVAISMILWPLVRLGFLKSVPGSLVGLFLGTILTAILDLDIPTIGAVPRSIFLEQRFQPSGFEWQSLGELIVPSLSIALLGIIESLLSAAVGGTMAKVRPVNNLELMAQGIGNVVMPFFGGVPATAAIARTSVAIKSGAVTRLTSVIHSLFLLLAALVFGSFIEQVPLAGLAGVLIVTAWRMNEWHSIRFYFTKKLKHAIAAFLVTLVATVVLDLTEAIVIGFAISSMIFMVQISELQITQRFVDWDRLQELGKSTPQSRPPISVFYVSGPLFFAAVWRLQEAIERQSQANQALVLSLRGVPLIDSTGVDTLRSILRRQRTGGGYFALSGLDPRVASQIQQCGLHEELGEQNIYWSADRAILDLGARLEQESEATELFVNKGELLQTELNPSQ